MALYRGAVMRLEEVAAAEVQFDELLEDTSHVSYIIKGPDMAVDGFTDGAGWVQYIQVGEPAPPPSSL